MQAPEALSGDGVWLGLLRDDDAPAYAAAFRDDPDLGRLIGAEKDPDEAIVRKRLGEDRGGFELAITADGSDAFRGLVAVHGIEPDHGRAEVGFWLVPQRGRRPEAHASSRSIHLCVAGGCQRSNVSRTPSMLSAIASIARVSARRKRCATAWSRKAASRS